MPSSAPGPQASAESEAAAAPLMLLLLLLLLRRLTDEAEWCRGEVREEAASEPPAAGSDEDDTGASAVPADADAASRPAMARLCAEAVALGCG